MKSILKKANSFKNLPFASTFQDYMITRNGAPLRVVLTAWHVGLDIWDSINARRGLFHKPLDSTELPSKLSACLIWVATEHVTQVKDWMQQIPHPKLFWELK
jgi:hypothetical protein